MRSIPRRPSQDGRDRTLTLGRTVRIASRHPADALHDDTPRAAGCDTWCECARLCESIARAVDRGQAGTRGWELGGKRVQLLKQAPPRIIRVGVLRNPSSSAIANEQKLIVQAATTLGISVTPVLVNKVTT